MGPPKYPCFNRYCQRFDDLFGPTLADKVIAPAEEKLKDRTFFRPGSRTGSYLHSLRGSTKRGRRASAFRSLPSSSSFRAINTTGRCLFSHRDQSWSWRQTIMLGQDTLPFRQQDWPNPTPPPSPGSTTTWNQTGMIGQDVLPSGSKTGPLPVQPPTPGNPITWRQTVMLGQDVLPFRQRDWPLPPLHALPRIDLSVARSQTRMLFQDVLPFRQTDWPLPALLRFGGLIRRSFLDLRLSLRDKSFGSLLRSRITIGLFRLATKCCSSLIVP
jgi:hypothetical protein